MRAAVQGKKQLFSMPNNTAIMVSFAACFALRLSTQISTGGSSSAALAPSVRTMIEETADVLEKIGNITRHRNGMCGLYAKYLRILVKTAAAETGPLSRQGQGTLRAAQGQLFGESSRQGSSPLSFATAVRKTASAGLSAGFAIPQPPSTAISAYDTGTPVWGSAASSAELFPFSSMSGDQIIEALNRAGPELDPGFGAGLGGGGGAAEAGGNGGGFGWEDGASFDFLPTWSNWPDFGF